MQQPVMQQLVMQQLVMQQPIGSPLQVKVPVRTQDLDHLRADLESFPKREMDALEKRILDAFGRVSAQNSSQNS